MLQSFPNPSVLFIFFSHFSRARFPALLFLGPIDIFFPFILTTTLGFSRPWQDSHNHTHTEASNSSSKR